MSSRFPMTLADFTSVGLMIPRLRGRDAASVIQELCQALLREGRVRDLLPFYHAALNREFLVHTDMAAGIAFPHARMPDFQELSFAMGRSEKPLMWGTRSAPTVRLVFLIAVPATDATQHLLLISGLACLAMEHSLIERLHAAPDPFQMLNVLGQIGPRSNPIPNSTAKPFTPLNTL